MCCFIADTPIEDPKGRIYTKVYAANMFQRTMMNASYSNCNSCLWCFGQCNPLTCCCTQYLLRRKALEYDMTKYECFQGYFNFCCFKAGSCCESKCPNLCLCFESCLCNSCAISATRILIMEKYDLQSDPCDFRLIRINNCLQLFSCICDLLSICIEELRDFARILDWITDIFYHCVSGCMTAQVAYELNYQQVLHNDIQEGILVEPSAPPYTGKSVYI